MQFQNVIAIVGIRIHAKKNINILYWQWLDRNQQLQIQPLRPLDHATNTRYYNRSWYYVQQPKHFYTHFYKNGGGI